MNVTKMKRLRKTMGFSHPCNLFSTLRVLYMTFLLFEILCRKVKRLDQSQLFPLVPKRFLMVGWNRVFGQSSKNLFESFLCSSSCSYFVTLRVLLYQSECLRVFPFSIVSKFSQQLVLLQLIPGILSWGKPTDFLKAWGGLLFLWTVDLVSFHGVGSLFLDTIGSAFSQKYN